MQSTLQYGLNSSVRLDVADQSLVADCEAPRGSALDDPAATVAAALALPIDFPALELAVTPGDRVTIAVGAGVPQAAVLVRPIVELLLARQVEPTSITILRSEEDEKRGAPDPRSLLDPAIREQVSLVLHDRSQRSQLSYLAATAEGRGIYLNRFLTDADLLIPISSTGQGPASGEYASGLYPTFSDEPTAVRYRHPSLANGKSEVSDRARQEAHEVGWLLGLLFSIEVVPGGGEEILAVLAGCPDAVSRQARALHRQAWSFRVPRRASLVVAAVCGDASEQTWENIGRAVFAASKVVADEGAICVLSDLQIQPGPGVQQLTPNDESQEIIRQLRRDRPHDMFPAVQIARAKSRAKVYLLSGLPESVVEELGLAPVEDAKDVARLAQRHRSCIVVSNAQRAAIRPEADE